MRKVSCCDFDQLTYVGSASLKFFSMITTFDTPLDVTTDELRVESFFPADADSDALLLSLAA